MAKESYREPIFNIVDKRTGQSLGAIGLNLGQDMLDEEKVLKAINSTFKAINKIPDIMGELPGEVTQSQDIMLLPIWPAHSETSEPDA